MVDGAQRLTASPPDEWGIVPGMGVWVGGHNVRGKRLALKLLVQTVRPTSGPIDLAVIAPESLEEAAYFARKLKTRLTAQGVIWVLYARTDQGEGTRASHDHGQLVRLMADEGLVAWREASIDASYTSTGFRVADRAEHEAGTP